MKKRLLSFITALLLIFTFLPVRALAAGTLSNFSRINTYTTGMFSDVPLSAWYASNLQLAYEYGLLNGISQSSFSPDSNLTIAEAIKIAAVINSIYNTGSAFTASGTPWFQPYADYALHNGIISSPYTNYNSNATRADFAKVLAAALPAEALTPINKIEDNTIPDVLISYSYGPAVYELYRAGVLSGSGSSHTFNPNDNIKRSEAAAIIARMVAANNRVTFSLAASNSESKDLTATDIAAKCSPAVFYIEVYDASGKMLASGSGFFINSSGLAVTNYHVIEGAASAKIATSTGQVYDVSGVYDLNPEYDLALLQISGSGFTALEIGDSSAITAGATIYAIGSPMRLDNSISQGIISNVSRSLSDSVIKYIQFDAAISHGSSGGALLNTKGQVIGVTTATAEDAQNLNFAVPVNLIRELKHSESVPLSTLVYKSSPNGSYTITTNPTNCTMDVGETVTVTIRESSGNPDYSLAVTSTDTSVVSGTWGDWTDNNTCTLSLTGLKAGTTVITVYLVDQNNTPIASTNIYVTVKSKTYSIITDSSNITIPQGNTKTITVQVIGGDSTCTLTTRVSKQYIISGKWGPSSGNNTHILEVTGELTGTTTLEIDLVDKNNKIVAKSTIYVTVTEPSYSVTASTSSLTLSQGNQESVNIICPTTKSDFSLKYSMSNPAVATCTWGTDTNSTSHTLNIIGIEPGSTTITIKLVNLYGNIYATLNITVTVVGSSSNSSVKYYPGFYPAPDFGALWGISPDPVYSVPGKTVSSYDYRTKDVPVPAEDAIQDYVTHLNQNGFTYKYTLKDGETACYSNTTFNISILLSIQKLSTGSIISILVLNDSSY